MLQTIPRLITAALCVFGALSLNGEATYISFSVPGGFGTYPMSINASMAVTGRYFAAGNVTRGFLRAADGTITTFEVPGALWTQPESINAAGDITGFYQLPEGPQGVYGLVGNPQGFIRYADGRIVTFAAPPADGFPAEAEPIAINDFDETAGNYPFYPRASIFTRSAGGLFNTAISLGGVAEARALNGSGSVVGYYNTSAYLATGFAVHPDGYQATITVPPLQPGQPCQTGGTYPEGINAAGTVAGWYVTDTSSPNCSGSSGGFVMSPDGVFTLFSLPGSLLTGNMPPDQYGDALTFPHWISIDQAGDVAGTYSSSTGQHGFLRSPYGTVTTFDPPEAGSTVVTGVSEGGAITGLYQYKAGAGPPVGFIRIP